MIIGLGVGGSRVRSVFDLPFRRSKKPFVYTVRGTMIMNMILEIDRSKQQRKKFWVVHHRVN